MYIIVLIAPVQSRPCTPCAGTSIRYKRPVPNPEEEEENSLFNYRALYFNY